jgi:hypothetical protein
MERKAGCTDRRERDRQPTGVQLCWVLDSHPQGEREGAKGQGVHAPFPGITAA